MKWIDLAVIPGFSWPNTQVEIPFESKRVVLSPPTVELSSVASLLVEDQGLSLEEGRTILSRFLSRLAWSRNGGVVELFAIGSNDPTRPGHRLGRGKFGTSGYATVEPWDCLYLPRASSPEADLALALFREGLSVNSIPFAFLSYSKVLNIAFSSGPAQMKWIRKNVHLIRYPPAFKRLQQLTRAAGGDIGAYLYGQCRCAVAHANETSRVNPDNYMDKRRLESDLPLMKEIAALFIETEFGVLSDDSFWKNLRETNGESPELLKRTAFEDGKVVYVPDMPRACTTF